MFSDFHCFRTFVLCSPDSELEDFLDYDPIDAFDLVDVSVRAGPVPPMHQSERMEGAHGVPHFVVQPVVRDQPNMSVAAVSGEEARAQWTSQIMVLAGHVE